jgi:hypothetical protein
MILNFVHLCGWETVGDVQLNIAIRDVVSGFPQNLPLMLAPNAHRWKPGSVDNGIMNIDDLPIVPHELADENVECCGCLIAVAHGIVADLMCYECGVIVRTVPLAHVEAELVRMITSQGEYSSATCRHCGAVQGFPFSTILIFICKECGLSNEVNASVQ